MCYAQWGLSWCIDRTVDAQMKAESSRYFTRSQATKKPDDIGLWPEGGGGNFVELTLRVVVRQAQGTMMAFQPKYAHGTTRLCGAHNRVCTITFSSHILQAYQTACAGTKVDGGSGAGDGNDSDAEIVN